LTPDELDSTDVYANEALASEGDFEEASYEADGQLTDGDLREQILAQNAEMKASLGRMRFMLGVGFVVAVAALLSQFIPLV
jgi:hypothetical protein